MKKSLKLICKILGYYTFWTMGLTVLKGFLDVNIIGIFGALIVHFPLGLALRWLSLLGTSNIDKAYVVLSDIFAVIVITGLMSVLAHYTMLNTYTTISANLIYGIVFIIIGSFGLLILNKVSLNKGDQYEDSNIY